MSSISTNFDKQTYTSTNLPVTTTLSGDISSIETAVNDNNTRLTAVEGNYVKTDGTTDFTALQSYSTDLTPSDDKNLTPKKYVDDSAILRASHNLPDGTGVNYQLTTSIATDDLTVAIKGIDGNDPSATNQVYFRVGNTILELTAALSVTADDSADHFGWDAGKIQGNDAQLFVYAINNNGVLQLGISPDPTLLTVATNYLDAGGQTGSAGHTNIIMSGTRNATNSCKVIGRVAVKQADDNDWEAPTTDTIIDSPIFETDALTYDPQMTGFSGTPTTSGKYKIVGDNCTVYSLTGSGTSNATGATITTPTIAQSTGRLNARVSDNGVAQTAPALFLVLSGAQAHNFYKDWAGTGFTASGTKDINNVEAFNYLLK